MINDVLQNTKERIPYKDSTELWDLSVTISGGVVPLSYVIQKIRNIANEFEYTCDVEVLMNLIVFKKVKLNICGESTEKRALKLKSKLEDYIHQF